MRALPSENRVRAGAADKPLEAVEFARLWRGRTLAFKTFVRWPSKAVDVRISGLFDGLGRPSYLAVFEDQTSWLGRICRLSGASCAGCSACRG